MTVKIKNLAKLTTDESKFESRPDQPFAWHDEGSERVDSKTGWYAHRPRDGNRLHGGSLLHGHRRQSAVSDNFYLHIKVFRYSGNGDTFVSDGV